MTKESKSSQRVTIVGVNFLQNFPDLERLSDLPVDCVVIDRDNWEKIIDFFGEHPDLVKELCK